MAGCNPTPTLTLFQTVVSTTVITTFTITPQTQADGSVSSVTQPLIITSLITLFNPTSTLYVTCPTTPLLTTTTQSPSPSPTVTTITITTTPLPFPVTTLQTLTLGNGATAVLTITTTSTPPVSTITSTALPGPTSKSSSNIAPIAGGVAGGFIFLVAVVALTWLIWKKCRNPSGIKEEEDVVFPYPVTRDRDQDRRLDLSKETRPYEYGLVGGAPGRLPAQSLEGRPDSSAPLIGRSSIGFSPMASASGPLATRQPSQDLHRLPPGAAPSHSARSVSASSSVGPSSPNRRPLHVTNSPPSLMPMLPGPSSGAAPGSSSTPLAGYEPEQQSTLPEKTHTRGASSSSGVILSNDGQSQGRDRRASVAAPAPVQSGPDAPPAYVA